MSADELRAAAERPWLEEGRIDEGRRVLAKPWSAPTTRRRISVRQQAARILGAGKAMFDRTGAAIDPGTAIEFERHVERTTAALGADFQVAWDGGYGLDDEDAAAAAAAYGT